MSVEFSDIATTSTASPTGLWVCHLLFNAQILNEKTISAGLLLCLKILLTCFRSRISDNIPDKIRNYDGIGAVDQCNVC